MSLIRDALKKAAGETESPSSSPLNKSIEKKRAGSFQTKKYGLLIFLLLCLGGVLVFQFFPLGQLFKEIQIPPTLKLLVKKEAPKSSVPAQEKEKAPLQQIIVTPPLPAAVQNQSLVKEKPLLMPVVPKKDEVKNSQLSTPGKEPAEEAMSQKSEGFLKATPPRFISPRPKAKIFKRTPLSARAVTKTQPPSEVPETPKAQATPTETDSLQVVRLFNEAVRNQQKGLFDQAIQAYQETLSFRPNHWETYNNLGLIYQQQKLYFKASEMFQKALSLNPHYLKAYNNFGLLYLKQGKFEEAISQFRKALDLDTNFLPAYINLSAAFNRQGQVEQARKVLLKALEHDSESIEAHYNLGLLWEKEGVESKAMEHYQKFVSKAQGPYCDLANELRKKWPGLK